MIKPWEPAEHHDVLRYVLQAENEARLSGLCDLYGQQTGRSGDAVRRFVWGLVVRLVEYIPYTGVFACTLYGPLSWAEEWVIRTAQTADSEEAREHRLARPDIAYIATLLCRDPADLKEAWNRLGPAAGRPGFGVWGTP